MITQGFIEAGLGAIREALGLAAVRAGLGEQADTITLCAARRFRSTVRQLETLLRRLIVLLAAQLELITAQACARPHTDPILPAKAGTALGQVQPQDTPGARPRGHYRFILTPEAGFDPAIRLALLGRPKLHPNCTGIGPLLDRFQTLMRHLDRPERLARRMARHLARMRAGGAMRPICPPPRHTHRLGHELGVIADYLPFAIHDALAGWYDTS